MQRRFKSEIVTENDCCITLTFVDSVCCLVNITTAAKAKAIQTCTATILDPLHCFFIDYSVSVSLIYTSTLSSALKSRFLLFLFAN